MDVTTVSQLYRSIRFRSLSYLTIRLCMKSAIHTFRGSVELKSVSSCSLPKFPWKSSCSNSLPVLLQTHYQEHFKFIEIFSSPPGEQQVSGAHAQPPQPLALFSSVFVPSETFFLPSRHLVEWSEVVSSSGIVGWWGVGLHEREKLGDLSEQSA